MQPLERLCNFVAPDFNWPPMLKFLRGKFAEISEVEYTARLQEFLKYMFLRSKYNKGFIPLTREVDEIWHQFILQTVQYQKLCESLPGKQFVHHNSIALNEYEEETGRATTVKNLLDWIPNYVNHFGPFTENAARHWMIVGFLQQELDLSLEQINRISAD